MLQTERLRLIPFSREAYEAIFDNDYAKLGTLLNIKQPNNFTEFEPSGHTLTGYYNIFKTLGNDLHWGSYFILSKKDTELIGTCCFKGKPANCKAEIGYEIFSDFRNAGYATECVRALVYFAFNENIQSVIAHTLTEENASIAVLRKCGFTFAGEIQDPEDGNIWAWTICK